MNEDAVPCARGRLLEFVQGIREGDVAFAQGTSFSRPRLTPTRSELDECGAVWCYSSLILVAGQLESAISIDKRELAALSDIAWEQLHTGYWKDVPCAWRNLYALTCIFKAYLGTCTQYSLALMTLRAARARGRGDEHQGARHGLAHGRCSSRRFHHGNHINITHCEIKKSERVC